MMTGKVVPITALALVLGLGAGYWLASKGHRDDAVPQSGSQARKPLFYRHPMNPNITSALPAKDEMGMDYVPVYVESESGEARGGGVAGTVSIDPVTVQNIGVRTYKATRQVLSRMVRAVGRVSFDEERLARLHPKTEGWVEQLQVDKTGEPVSKDTILLSLYSPQLVSSQEEYLLALKNQRELKDSPYPDIRRGAEVLVATARSRLALLDVPEHQIHELEQTGIVKKNLHIHSPFDGIVLNVGTRSGQYVTPQTELYRIADLSTVWVYVDVYEYELPWVGRGDQAEMRLAGVPGQTFRGRVDYIYPYAEATTRTIKVRVVFDNPQHLLKPDMFADVDIHAGRRVESVVIPTEAVLRSGTRDQIFVVRAPGKFEPRQVRLGLSSEGLVQVLSGIEVGEEVVISAQFLIDSESKLREATAKMLEPASGDNGAPGPVQTSIQHAPGSSAELPVDHDHMSDTDGMVHRSTPRDVNEHAHHSGEAAP